MDGMWCVPRGRSDREAVSLMCWGWAFCTRASGVCLVSLKALTSPSLHLHLHSSTGPLRCRSPHSTITLPLLNIYGSQETRSQQQLFYSHTFFSSSLNRLSSSSHNFVFHSFLGGNLRLLQSFCCWSEKSGFVGLQIKPQCHPVVTTGHYSRPINTMSVIFLYLYSFMSCFKWLQ